MYAQTPVHSDRFDTKPATPSKCKNALHRAGLSCSIAIALLMATGCNGLRSSVLGMSVEDRPIDCQRMGYGRDTVMILATIHGNEAAGTPLVRRLVQHLQDEPKLLKGRRVVILPVVNPDGYVHNSRFNVNGVDLNRNFPADNFDASPRHGAYALCEPESQAIRLALDKYRPNRVVSIHQPVACIDYDGPAEALANAMGATTNLPVKRIGSRPGSLGSYVGLTMDTPIITLELPATATSMDDDSLWKAYGDCLLAAIRYPDPLPG